MFKLNNFLKPQSAASGNVHHEDMDAVNKTDNTVKEDFKYISASGAQLFKVKTGAELYEENLILIDRIYSNLCISKSLYDNFIHPLIKRFISLVNVAPASECAHDSGAGGLIRHSLLVADTILSLSRSSLYRVKKDDIEKYRCSLVLLALAHDLSKIVTDVSYTTPGGRYTFDPDSYPDGLEEFIQEHNCTYLRCKFVGKRQGLHDRYQNYAITYLLYGLDEFTDYLKDDDKDSVYYILLENRLKGSEYRSLLKHADSLACCISINEFSSLYEIGNFLKNYIVTDNFSYHHKGLYRLRHGYLFEQGSPAYARLIEVFDAYNNLILKAEHVNLSSEFNTKDESINYEKLLDKDADFDAVSENNNEIEELLKSLPEYFFGVYRKPFFRIMDSSHFYNKILYKNPFAYHELIKDGKISVVYGFCVEMTSISNNDDYYRIIGNYKDSDLRSVIRNLLLTADDDKQVTYFELKKGALLEHMLDDPLLSCRMVDPKSIRFNTFRVKREEDNKERAAARKKKAKELAEKILKQETP